MLREISQAENEKPGKASCSQYLLDKNPEQNRAESCQELWCEKKTERDE